MIFRLSSTLACLLLALCPPTPSLGAPAKDAPVFEESSQLLAVEVPVTVVGRDGRPVRGLVASDFEIYDDSGPQPIATLEVVDLEAIGRGDEVAVEREVNRMRSSLRRHFLLLFDFSYSTPVALLKARAAARRFVAEELHPADLAAVATVSLEQGVRLVVTFTPDRAQLARGIDTLGAHAGGERSASLDPLRFMVVDPAGLDSAAIVGRDDGTSDREAAVAEYLSALGQQLDRSQSMFDRTRVTGYTRVLGDLARSLDAVKGRKHVVLFSEGFESRLLLGREPGNAEEQVDAEEISLGRIWQVDTDNRFGNTELQTSLNQMVDEFRRADCVIQAVDIGGLRARGEAGPAARSGKDALFVLANQTGGELFEGANDLGAQLERLLARNSVTYVLTFERSDVKQDGSFHRLRVRLKNGAGARLAHRSGYYAPRPYAELHRFERDLLASDQIASAAANRDIDLRVLTTAFRSGSRNAYVPVVVEAAGLGLVAGTPDDSLEVELFIYVSDREGRMRDFISQVFSLGGKNRGEGLRQGGLKYYGDLLLPPGDYVVRVLVRNAETGRAGVESTPLRVPDFTLPSAAVLPPFFKDRAGQWLLVRKRAAVEGGLVVYPFVVNGEPFVPSARGEVRSGESVALCVVAYNQNRELPALEGLVRDSAGQPARAASLRVTERTATGIEGLDKLVVEFDAVGISPGDYTLEVRFADAGPGSPPSPTSAFTVLEAMGGTTR